MAAAPIDGQREALRTPTRISDWGLFLGGRTHAVRAPALGIDRVLCVAERVRFVPGVATAFEPISDYGTSDLLAEGGIFERCFDAIAAARTANERLLVHCSLGVNRSPTVVLAWLVHDERTSLADAYARVKDLRPQISPHERYFEQLQEFEKRELGIDEPSLTREDIGPSLQEMLRAAAGEDGGDRDNDQERK
jgi:protein-tyrosine phosphatase